MAINLEDLIERHLAGEQPVIPDELRGDFERALAGHAALVHALGETLVAEATDEQRDPPALPEDYAIVRELGRGGMGVVYLVEQKSLGRFVAVKVLRPGERLFGKIVQRFLDEARHLARLRHPNIVSVHEVGRAGEEPYFTMDFVDGRSLSQVLAAGRLSPSQALAIWKQAAAGVEHAHAQGIIHRDLKPGNILIDGTGHAFVTDFGLARDMAQSASLTRTGEVLGTPAYMAPEQALGQSDRIGEATDVHALGVILYEMLTGTSPFGRGAPADVLVKLLRDEPVPPRTIDRRIPRDLETICLKAMSREPERRYATVKALLEDVRRFEAGEPILARRPGLLYRSARFLRRQAKPIVAAAGAGAIVLAAAVLLSWRSSDEIVAEGDTSHAWGKHQEAIGLYRRALARSGTYGRLGILERIVRCAQESGDREQGIDAALQSLQFDPHAWFGPYNGDVARAVVERKIAVPVDPGVGSPVALSTEELALVRLRMFLAGPEGNSPERQAAELQLAAMARALNKTPEESLEEILPGWKPPAEAADELLAQAGDESRSLAERAQAALFAASALDRAGEREAALSAYRRSFELLRSAHPVYFGLCRGIESTRPRSLHFEPEESRLLRHVAGAIRRLDPDAAERLRGGVRLRIGGLDLAPELGLHLWVSIWAASAGQEETTTAAPPQGEVPVQLDQSAWVGVADGRYRISVRDGARSGYSSEHLGARARQLFQLLALDFGGLPDEVEIRGETVDLPSIRAFLLENVQQIEPAEGGTIDVETLLFRWAPVSGAHHYEVGILEAVSPESGGTSTSTKLVVKASGAQLRRADLTPEQATVLRELPASSILSWVVRAYDASGRLVGKSLDEREVRIRPSAATE